MQPPRIATQIPSLPALSDRRTFWWWSSLYLVSAANVLLWILAARRMSGHADPYVARQLLLSVIYVAACAFRSLLPRVDLERQCLWNTPLSSIFLGRTVATVAEMCFAAQCALLVLKLSAISGIPALRAIGLAIVPLILVAQIACWHAVLTLNHVGHAVEEILWSAMVLLLAFSLGISWNRVPANLHVLGAIGIAACAGAAFVMLVVDVPMYVSRWRRSKSTGVRFLPVVDGLRDALVRRRVAHGWGEWRPEVPWMSLYFSVGVWLSLGLIFA
jgi:hypothetical protein